VSAHSRQYPRISGDHPVGVEFDEQTPIGRFAKGNWHWNWERDVDHLDICVLPQADQIGWQRRFYIDSSRALRH